MHAFVRHRSCFTSHGSLLSILSSRTSVHCSGGGAFCRIRTGLATSRPAEPPDTSELVEPFIDMFAKEDVLCLMRTTRFRG